MKYYIPDCITICCSSFKVKTFVAFIAPFFMDSFHPKRQFLNAYVAVEFKRLATRWKCYGEESNANKEH